MKFIELHKNLFSLLCVIGIFLLAVFFRVIGLAYDFPYINNIDEPALIRSSLGLRFSPWIDHFDWPHFNFYLQYIFYEIFIKFRVVLRLIGFDESARNAFPILWNDPYIFYLISRFASVLFYSGTVFIIYILVKKLTGKILPAILASLVFVLIPYGFFITHFAIQEPVLLFIITLALYLTYLCFKTQEKVSVWLPLLCGLIWGASISTKYNAVLFALPAIVLMTTNLNSKKDVFDYIKNRIFIRKVSFIVLMILASVLLFNISAIKYWDVFWSDTQGRGILWQFGSNLNGVENFSEYKINFIRGISEFSVAMGQPLLLLFGFGAVFTAALYKKTKNNKYRTHVLLSLSVIIIFMLTYKYRRAGPHYVVPLYSLVSICIGMTLSFVYELIQKVKSDGLLFASLKLIFYSSLLSLFSFTMQQGLKISEPFLYSNNFSEAALMAKEIEESKGIKVYVDGSEFNTFVAINNLGFKKKSDDSRIETGDLVISETLEEKSDYDLISDFSNRINLSGSVYIYEKK